MADTAGAQHPTPTTRDAAALPAEGLPVFDAPPLIEPLAPAESPAADDAVIRRPVRRRFLPPVGDLPEQARVHPAERVTPAAGRAAGGASGRARELLGWAEPGDAPASGAPPRRWPRRVAVGAGIAAALALAVALELGVVPARLGGMVLALLSPPVRPPSGPALPDPAVPPSDPAQRVAFYAERGKAGDSAAQLALAILYAKGDGVAQDYGEAAKWFRAAAERGLARAQYDLGVLYEHGRGVPVDYALAGQWYRKAAEQRHPLAQYNLAVAYTKGQGVGRDFFEAATWYRRAAQQGVVAAMVNLAVLYERGDGMEASRVDAYAWYRAAARRGSEPAARRADQLLQGFSPLEQTSAEAKTADVAASIEDAVAERTRLVAETTAANPGDAPALKSGFADPTGASGDGGAVHAENP